MNALAKVTSGFLRVFGRETVQPKPPELLVATPKPMVGLFAKLDESQKKQALTFSGNHNFGAKGEVSSKVCS